MLLRPNIDQPHPQHPRPQIVVHEPHPEISPPKQRKPQLERERGTAEIRSCHGDLARHFRGEA